MKKWTRAKFFKKITLATAVYLLTPKIPFAKTIAILTKTAAPKFTMDPAAIIDLHCHPSLKIYLMNKKMWAPHWLVNPGSNLVHMQEDSKQLTAGFVRGMVATHYLPEIGITKNWRTVSFLWPAITRYLFYTSDKIEHGDSSNFTQINTMIDDLENQVHIVNDKLESKGHPLRFVIARNFNEFQKALDPANDPLTIPIAHAIEGAHSLGRNLYPTDQAEIAKQSQKKSTMIQPYAEGYMKNAHDDNAELYLANLRALKLRGVCMITLGHFFQNDLAYPVDGISDDAKKLPGICWNYDNDTMNFPLKAVGRAVVREMLESGMIVDITHTTPATRDEVFKLNRDINESRVALGKHRRPLVFTHVGAIHIFEEHDKVERLQHYKFYDVRDEDIKAISECDGVIGVIPENFWLVGADTHMRMDGFSKGEFKKGIKYIVETIIYINSQTKYKDFRNIGLGTDFDGLADNPQDLYKASQLGELIKAIREMIPGITEEQVKAITTENALRLLRNGWSD